MHIVDRRLNPGSKSLENRQRFRCAKARVQGALEKSSQDRDIRDVLEGGEVSIPLDGMLATARQRYRIFEKSLPTPISHSRAVAIVPNRNRAGYRRLVDRGSWTNSNISRQIPARVIEADSARAARFTFAVCQL
jgi:hypothetical protein